MLIQNKYQIEEIAIDDYKIKYSVYRNDKLSGWCLTEFGKVKEIHTVSSINETLIVNLLSNLF